MHSYLILTYSLVLTIKFLLSLNEGEQSNYMRTNDNFLETVKKKYYGNECHKTEKKIQLKIRRKTFSFQNKTF